MDEAEEMQVERVHEEADTDKLSYEIFSILESKFLFGYTDPHQLWLPKPPAPPPPPPPAQASAAAKAAAQRGKVCVLCVDGGGGGLRALLAGRALAHLEAALRRASGDPAARVADYFDLAAGTGAGGVFAAMLFSTYSRGAPLFHADDAWRLVADHAPRLFRPPSSSSSGPSLFRRGRKRPLAAPTAALEASMRATFGEELTLRDTIKPVLISCYDLRTAAPLVFSRADALESASYDFRLCDVGRAAWSEPGRFEPAEVASVDGATTCAAVDGGPTMGSPAAAAITHVLHNKHEFPFVRGVEDLLVLSIGGCSAGGGAGAAGAADARRMKKWGPKEWARPIARIAADGAADLVDHAVARAFGQCRSSNYLRIQAKRESMPPCGPDGEYEPTPANVSALLAAADEMLKQRNVESVLFEGRRVGEQTNAEKLERFAAELVAEHRSRGSRIAPTVAFKQAPQKPSSALG